MQLHHCIMYYLFVG